MQLWPAAAACLEQVHAPARVAGLALMATRANRREPSGDAPDEMPQQPAQANRFGKARQARSATQLEDYAELIADLLATGGEARTVDIARRMGVAHATAVKTIGRLKREGLVTALPYRGVFLTEAGETLAARVRARHRLVVELLVAVGVPLEDAEADAEGIEHYVSESSLAAFARFLNARGK